MNDRTEYIGHCPYRQTYKRMRARTRREVKIYCQSKNDISNWMEAAKKKLTQFPKWISSGLYLLIYPNQLFVFVHLVRYGKSLYICVCVFVRFCLFSKNRSKNRFVNIEK